MRSSLTVFIAALVLPVLAPGQQVSPVTDAFGDAQDTFGSGPPLLDIDVIDVRYDEESLHFSMTFHTPVSPPSTGNPNSVGGNLEFDTDQNPVTGTDPLQNAFSPPFANLNTGVEFFLDLFSESQHPGSVDLISTSSGPVGTVPVTYGANSLSGSIPLGGMLGGDDGLVDFTGIIGTFNQPTDAMDVYGISALVPEPASLVLLSALGLLAARRR